MVHRSQYQPGDHIGDRYQVHRALWGGMGEVYLCLDLETRRPYALKTIQASRIASAARFALFRNEVENWIALEKHPNLVRCFFMKTLAGVPFMFLEWVASEEPHTRVDLRSRLAQGPLDLRTVLTIGIDICRGLAHAQHKRPGLVHGDLKPENILLAHGNTAKITDFGLARVFHADDTASVEAGSTEERATQPERQRALIPNGGTPAYMAPEVWLNQPVDERTDLYALGCLLYELVTGRQPYMAATMQELRRLHLTAAPPAIPSTTPDAAALQPVVTCCLAKQVAERYGDVNELAATLTQIYRQAFGEPPRAPEVSEEFTVTDYYNRGLTYFHLDCYPEALTDFTTVLERSPADSEAHLNRGSIYLRLQQPAAALAAFTQALQLEPTLVKAYVNRGNAYAQIGQSEQGLADLTNAIRLNPALAAAYFNRANLYNHLDRLAEALADYSQAITLDPAFVSAYANRANVYAALERYEEALRDYHQVVTLEPDHERAYFNRGLLYATLQRPKEALADFAHVLHVNPTDAQAHYYKGLLHYQQQEISDALHHLHYAAAQGLAAAHELATQIQQAFDGE